MNITMKVLMLMSLFCPNIHTKNTPYCHEMPNIQSIEDVVALFPKTVDEIQHLAQKTLADVKTQIQSLVNLPLQELTFDNTVRRYDQATDTFARTTQIIESLLMLSPSAELRDAAQKELMKLQEVAVDLFTQNKDLFQVLSHHAQTRSITEKLEPEEQYFEQETLEEFIRNGVGLPDDKRAVVGQLQKELSSLCTQFDKNINDDATTITVDLEELDGIDQDFIDARKKTEDGKIILGVDYPTYYKIMDQCHNANTRKKLFRAFSNKAYPANIEILEKIIALRDELAQRLQTPSYAHLTLAGEMAKSPEIVEKFLFDLWQKASQKESLEFKLLTKELPESVELSPEGTIQPWDKDYITQEYKKKNYNIDDSAIAEYFPMKNTVDGLLKIYETFFGITFKQINATGLWHEEVTALEVYRDKTLLGYILLDLYPRPFKYGHACQITIVPALLSEKKDVKPSVVIVVTNFPRASANKPSLLSRSDVSTFFHEFGHALHAILGATRLASQSGTHTKHDFVELPSQMLEEWLFDKDILRNLSHHYKTGAPLSPETIEKLVALKNLSSGTWVTRQIFISLIALEYFKPGAQKDTQAIMQALHEKIRLHHQFDSNDHFQTSFGHLTGYGARYYGYLWSKVFALDLFATIKQHGLLNPKIGAHYVDNVLSKGGSKDPNELLFDFLGRNPNNEAFLRDLGL